MVTLPDPADLPWPRRTTRTTLRPVTEDDVDAMLAYRSDPVVVEHLSHDVLDRSQVRDRVRSRMPGGIPTPGRVVRGVAVEVDGELVGDAMLRVVPGDAGPELWIGYALRHEAWGQGLATEVARALVDVGDELGLPVRAEVYAGNPASARVLEKSGLDLLRRDVHAGRPMRVYGRDPA